MKDRTVVWLYNPVYRCDSIMQIDVDVRRHTYGLYASTYILDVGQANNCLL